MRLALEIVTILYLATTGISPFILGMYALSCLWVAWVEDRNERE